MQTERTTTFTCERKDMLSICAFETLNNEYVALTCGGRDGFTVRFTEGQIPDIEELLAALKAKREAAGGKKAAA